MDNPTPKNNQLSLYGSPPSTKISLASEGLKGASGSSTRFFLDYLGSSSSLFSYFVLNSFHHLPFAALEPESLFEKEELAFLGAWGSESQADSESTNETSLCTRSRDVWAAWLTDALLFNAGGKCLPKVALRARTDDRSILLFVNKENKNTMLKSRINNTYSHKKRLAHT